MSTFTSSIWNKLKMESILICLIKLLIDIQWHSSGVLFAGGVDTTGSSEDDAPHAHASDSSSSSSLSEFLTGAWLPPPQSSSPSMLALSRAAKALDECLLETNQQLHECEQLIMSRLKQLSHYSTTSKHALSVWCSCACACCVGRKTHVAKKQQKIAALRATSVENPKFWAVCLLIYAIMPRRFRKLNPWFV